jgi:hypothetical protein
MTDLLMDRRCDCGRAYTECVDRWHRLDVWDCPACGKHHGPAYDDPGAPPNKGEGHE